jgi:hypothetical protein
MSLRLAVALLFSIFYFTGPQVGLVVVASESSEAKAASEKQLSLEQLEALNEFENLKGSFDELEAMIDRMSRTFEQKCLSAFGHTSFCHFITKNRPVAANFESYILAATKTKEELGFNKMKTEDQQIVMILRQTRDQCVKAIP